MELFYGDIIKSKKHQLYYHYGVYIGGNLVIHYTSFPFHIWLKKVSITITSIENFQKGGKPPIIHYHPESPNKANAIVNKANNRLGEMSYNIFTNNCKHFVNYCIQ